jgi:hypothetical protein
VHFRIISNSSFKYHSGKVVSNAQTPDLFSLTAALLAWFSAFFCLQDFPAFSCALVCFGALSFFLDFGGIFRDVTFPLYVTRLFGLGLWGKEVSYDIL